MALDAFLIRSGSVIKRLVISSASVPLALNEIQEASVETFSREEILDGDKVRFVIDGTTYGDYSITIFEHSLSADSGYTTSMTLVPCANILQSVAMPGSDPFQQASNLGVFTQISSFILQETGVYFPVSFINADSVLMGARFAVNASNALDMLRSLCGATNNAFRLSRSCGIEIGKFGADSGFFIKTGGNGRYKNILYPTSVVFTSDSSDVYGAIYVEGGSFDKGGKSINLQMGSFYVTQFTVETPAGFTMVTSTAGEKTYYKLTKDGGPITKSKKIQVSGIVPEKENDLDSEIAAATLLTHVASNYLEAKSVPNIIVTCRFDGYMQGFDLGDSIRVYLADEAKKSKDTIIDQDLFVTGIEYSIDGDIGYTNLTLSNRLSDPEDLLQAAKGSKSGDMGHHPYQEFGQYANVILTTASEDSPVCDGTGREIYVNYAAYGYISTPHITVSCPSGYSGIVTASDLTDATICINTVATWTTTPVVISILLSGDRG